jgi:hypothetical protein
MQLTKQLVFKVATLVRKDLKMHTKSGEELINDRTSSFFGRLTRDWYALYLVPGLD